MAATWALSLIAHLSIKQGGIDFNFPRFIHRQGIGSADFLYALPIFDNGFYLILPDLVEARIFYFGGNHFSIHNALPIS